MKGTINDYIKAYGKYTFLEEPFNEVDNVILSLISYIDFYNIVPPIGYGKITLKEASNRFYKKYSEKEINHNILSVKHASYLLKELALTNRFKDLLLYNYMYHVTFDMQFGALCILLPNNNIYVSFEGTDNYVSGWKEDCMFTYSFPTLAQQEAINYLNKVIGIFSSNIYVGGHSKGGNLALVSSMYCKGRVRKKIKQVFINDAPGLRKKEFESKQYKKIFPKLKMLVPKSSVIGMLLRHSNNFVVVDSKNKSLMQHDATSWIVEENHFKYTNQTEFSKKIEKGVTNWLDKWDDINREKFVTTLFSVLSKAEIDDLNDFREAKINNIIKIIKEMKNVDKETRSIMLTIMKDLMMEIK